MTTCATFSVRDALRLHYDRYGLPGDGGRKNQTWGIAGLEYSKWFLNNFEWRKKALMQHDIHHLVTGYPCTAKGELLIATWEFAAGRYPDFRATLFCLPLVCLGALLAPHQSFAAFVRGRHSKTLYPAPVTDMILSTNVEALRAQLLPAGNPYINNKDRCSYVALVGLSLLQVTAPIILLTLLFLNHA